jgi:multiple antibiotic resistance protein
MIEEVFKASISLFMIMSPFSSIPIFLAVTRNVRNKLKPASQAIGVASVTLFTFLFLGREIMDIFNISLSALKIAGGVVLTILGIELVLGTSFIKAEGGDYSPAISLIGTPLLTGPGVIVSTMIFTEEYGYVITIIAALISLTASWLILLCSEYIDRFIGDFWRETISRVTGFLLVAIAVEFIVSGVRLTLIGSTYRALPH